LKIGDFKILLSVVLLWISLSSATFAQSKNFEGFGLAIDYSLNAITDQSIPGGSETSNSGIPSITADYFKAISEQWLVGAYGSYDLVTTDTTGTDPDAHNPIEIGGKLGYALNEKLMAYAKLGYSASKYSSPGFYQWLHGSSYGIGVEYLLTKHLFTRFEVSQQSYKTIYWSDGSSDKVWINSYGISLGWRF
jgi:opacity protein-like surface antigen